MKMLLLAAGKPLFGLLTGMFFVAVPVTHERAIEIEQMEIERMQELEQFQGDAPDGAEPEDAPDEGEDMAEEAPER